MTRGLSLGLTLVLLSPGLASAQEPATPPAAKPVPAACTAFDWPLMREMAWLEAPSLPKLASGDELPSGMPGAALALKPSAEVAYPVPPSRKPKPDTFGGVLRMGAPMSPGLYQITLSDEAWLDVSQDGQGTLRPTAHTGQRDCPGLRKSLRFQLGTKPVTIEVSNARADSIRIAVAPVE